MKLFGLIILTGLSYIATVISAIWTIVEFIIYLAKDHVFNWVSLFTLIGGIIFTIISVMISVIVGINYKHREMTDRKKQMQANLNGTRTSTRKSGWQQRLEEMAEERKRKIKNNFTQT